MYGIVGFTRTKSDGIKEKEIIQRMIRSSERRNHAEKGLYIDQYIGLGYCPLNIMELKKDRRPLHNENRSIWLIFDGKIYNYEELRQDLEKLGHNFYTDAEGEAILHLYEQYGRECIGKCNGEFVFAIWDKAKQKLLLARDRMGIKPLYYTQIDTQLIFASELKVLFRHPNVEKQIDYCSLQRYLIYEYVPAPFTMFKDIKKLLPAHILEFQNGRSTLNRYWHVNFTPKLKKLKEKDYIEQFRQLLKSAVKRRLFSGNRLGVFLSGGIDSSTITAIMSELLSEKLQSFSIGFEDPSFDESKYARIASSYFNTKHNLLILRPKDLLQVIPSVIGCLNEPLGDASMIPTYLLSKFAKEQVDVVLGGDGADELFAGYDTYKAHKLMKFYSKIPMPIQRSINSILNRLPVSTDNFSFDFKLKRFISAAALEPALRHIVWMGSFAPQELAILLKDGINPNLDLEEEIELYLKECDADELIEQMQYLDMRLYLQEGGLTKVNSASVASSLEVRTPFLDHTLIEFVAKLPAHFKLHGFTSKYLLKKSMQNTLPKQVLRRTKKGFGVPIAKWLQSDLKEILLDYLNKEHINKEGIFNYNYVRLLLDEHFSKRRDNRKLLWTLFIFELWYEKYLR